MMGQSPSFREMVRLLGQVARYDTTVLLQGETGSGKELAARALHYDGPRSAKPFVPINCGALQDTLIENELFGHCRGAYTGAHSDEPGMVEAARGGTLFLDEVDALSPKGQVTLLRFLEDQQYRPVGGRASRTADVRVVSASNRSLMELVRADRFREDLLYRLRVMYVPIPPLRDRTGDGLLLAHHFVRVYSVKFHKPVLPFSSAAITWMDNYRWPGNIRELENVVCEAFLLAHGQEIEMPPMRGCTGDAPPDPEVWNYRRAKQRAIDEFERRFLSRVISSTAGNVSEAARKIETERRHLGRLLKKHGIAPLTLSSAEPRD
jgi:two-component system, NtrC family, response regulator GlrR